mgnify:CR=1 FL=1
MPRYHCTWFTLLLGLMGVTLPSVASSGDLHSELEMPYSVATILHSDTSTFNLDDNGYFHAFYFDCKDKNVTLDFDDIILQMKQPGLESAFEHFYQSRKFPLLIQTNLLNEDYATTNTFGIQQQNMRVAGYLKATSSISMKTENLTTQNTHKQSLLAITKSQSQQHQAHKDSALRITQEQVVTTHDNTGARLDITTADTRVNNDESSSAVITEHAANLVDNDESSSAVITEHAANLVNDSETQSSAQGHQKHQQTMEASSKSRLREQRFIKSLQGFLASADKSWFKSYKQALMLLISNRQGQMNSIDDSNFIAEFMDEFMLDGIDDFNTMLASLSEQMMLGNIDQFSDLVGILDLVNLEYLYADENLVSAKQLNLIKSDFNALSFTNSYLENKPCPPTDCVPEAGALSTKLIRANGSNANTHGSKAVYFIQIENQSLCTIFEPTAIIQLPPELTFIEFARKAAYGNGIFHFYHGSRNTVAVKALQPLAPQQAMTDIMVVEFEPWYLNAKDFRVTVFNEIDMR